MNKFNKTLEVIALLAVAVIGLVGCKKNADVLGITEKLANKTMLWCYVCTEVDSVTMTTFTKECMLNSDKDGNKTGYYRECRFGQGAPADVKRPFTYETSRAADNLSMDVVATFENGEQLKFKWADGAVTINNQVYPQTMSGYSDIDVLLKIYENLANTEFASQAATYHEHIVKVPYLEWKTAVKYYAPEDTAQAKADYLEALKPYTDTIVWFLREIVPSHTLGYARLDTVIDGVDTTYVVADLVYVDPKASEKSKNLGKHCITYLASRETTRDVQQNDRPKTLMESTMAFNVTDNSKTAVYTLTKHEWSDEFYKETPDVSKVITHDSIYTFNASEWIVPAYTNGLKFEILLSGKSEFKEKKVEGGVEKINKEAITDNDYHKLLITGFNKTKGVATEGELNYKLKK